MSYCRFSSNDFASDVYAYESADGFVTHVAVWRIMGDIPKIDWTTTDAEAFAATTKAQADFMETAQREPLLLPYDGRTFIDSTLEEFEGRLRMLAAAGYRVPGAAFMIIAAEKGDVPAE